jgi:Na+/phosphate symporter
MTAVVSILAGLGLFFFGLETLGDNLKRLAGRRLRATVTRFARNRWLGFLSAPWPAPSPPPARC